MGRIRRHVGTIIVAFVVASVASGGTALAIVANAHKVDGYHANQLVRATSNGSGNLNDFDATSFSNAMSIIVNAPRNGVLLLWASVNPEWDSDSDPGSVGELYGRMMVDGVRAGYGAEEALRDLGTISKDITMAWNGAIPVEQGSHTVEMQFQLIDRSGDSMAVIKSPYLVALFVPFNNQGIPPIMPGSLLSPSG